MPDRQRLQGSWVAKKMQSFVAGRPSLGLAKKAWMQLISPWRRGERRSLLDSIVMGARVARERMAAPKSLQPSETRERVRGMMWDSVGGGRGGGGGAKRVGGFRGGGGGQGGGVGFGKGEEGGDEGCGGVGVGCGGHG